MLLIQVNKKKRNHLGILQLVDIILSIILLLKLKIKNYPCIVMIVISKFHKNSIEFRTIIIG